MVHLLMENQSGLIIDAMLTPASGTAEREAAFSMLGRQAGRHRATLGTDKGSQRPGHEGAGRLTRDQVRAIAERKLPDLNTTDVEAAMKAVAGSARSMGITVKP